MPTTQLPNYLSAIDTATAGKLPDADLKTLATPLQDKKDALNAAVDAALELPGTSTLQDEEQAKLLREGFEFATKLIRLLAKQPGRTELLEPWVFFKHGTQQEEPAQPSAFNFEGKAKYRRYQEVKGTSYQKSQAEYIKVVEAQIEKYGLQQS